MLKTFSLLLYKQITLLSYDREVNEANYAVVNCFAEGSAEGWQFVVTCLNGS